MKYDIKVGMELLDNDEFEEAFKVFSGIIEEDSKNLEARYYRAYIDFFHFHKEPQQDYEDLKMLVDKKTKFKELSLPLLVILAEEFHLKDEVIKYARMSLNYDNPYSGEMKNILIKHLLFSKEYVDILEAMKIIDSMIEDEEEATLDVYLQKIETQIIFKDFDGADNTIQQAFTKFSGNAHLYLLKGNLACRRYQATNDMSYMEDAISAFQISLQYNPLLNNARISLAEAYTVINNLEMAFKTIDDFREALDHELSPEETILLEADLVVEKVKLCEINKEWDKALEFCQEFLSKYDNWKVYYSYGYILSVIATSHDDLRVAENYLLKAYQGSKYSVFLCDIVTVNTILGQYDVNDKLIKEALEAEPDNGLLYYLKAENDLRFNYDYDSLIASYKKAFELGYLDLPSYVTQVSFLVEKPLEFIKKHHKALVNQNLTNPWDVRRMGIRYLFGELGFKQNLSVAYKYLHDAFTQEPTEPCILTIYGRCLELLGKNEEAFQRYEEAYKYYAESIHITCSCACGYLGYAYLMGIGTEKDIDKAKELVLEGINKDGIYSAGINIFLYAYFSLLGEEGFELQKALEYLSSDYPFDRYNVVRLMFINRVLKKLGKAERYTEVDIKKCLKNQTKDYTKYYKQNKNNEIIFPYYKIF